MGFFYNYVRSHPYVRNNLQRSALVKAKVDHKRARTRSPFIDDYHGYKFPLHVANMNQQRIAREQFGRLPPAAHKKGTTRLPAPPLFPVVNQSLLTSANRVRLPPPPQSTSQQSQRKGTVGKIGSRHFSMLQQYKPQQGNGGRGADHGRPVLDQKPTTNPSSSSPTITTKCEGGSGGAHHELPPSVQSVVQHETHNPLNPYHVYAVRYNLYSNLQRHNPVTNVIRDATTTSTTK